MPICLPVGVMHAYVGGGIRMQGKGMGIIGPGMCILGGLTINEGFRAGYP